MVHDGLQSLTTGLILNNIQAISVLFSCRTLFAWCESVHTISWSAKTKHCHNVPPTFRCFRVQKRPSASWLKKGWPSSGKCTSTADQLFHCCHWTPLSDQLFDCCHSIFPTSYLIVAIQSHFLTSWDRSEALEGFRAGYEAAKFSGQMLLRHRWLQYFQILNSCPRPPSEIPLSFYSWADLLIFLWQKVG